MRYLIFLFYLFIILVNIQGQVISTFNVLNDPYGICSHISRKGVDWEVRDKDLKLIKEVNINYVRTDFDWNRIQNSFGESSHYQTLDSMMQSIRNSNIQILPILGYDINTASPAWQHLPEWNNYVSAVVKRYNAVPVWEVWNEMNSKFFWRGNPSASQYLLLLKSTYQTIKSIDSHKQVMLGGLAGMDKDYLSNLCKLGGQNYFDIMNFHYYSGQNVPETIIKNCFIPLREIMEQYHWNKPVWITEAGYPTAMRNDNISEFYLEVLPQVYSKINLNPSTSTIAFIVDNSNNWDSTNGIDVDGNFRMFAHRISITLDELKTLDPKRVQLLVPTSNEAFPTTFFNDLENYVRKGGTILLPYGAPFYYTQDLQKKKSLTVGNTYCSKLHVNCLYWWDEKASKLHAPKLADWIKSAPDFKTIYTWNSKDPSGLRYLTGANLKGGDVFIPIIQAGNKQYTGTVVGLYKLNSDLKGNVIIHTRMSNNANVSLETQAKRLPRTYLTAFAYGVEKVFWYNLRAMEYSPDNSEAHFGVVHKDFTPKPAYYAYKTLTTLCPDGSTRPALQVNNGVYIAQWKRPDGEKVAAIWTENIEKKIFVKITGQIQTVNYKGFPINISLNEFYAKPEVTYILGFNSITIKK